jgi:hypothetical protein
VVGQRQERESGGEREIHARGTRAVKRREQIEI